MTLVLFGSDLYRRDIVLYCIFFSLQDIIFHFTFFMYGRGFWLFACMPVEVPIVYRHPSPEARFPGLPSGSCTRVVADLRPSTGYRPLA